MKTLLGRDEAEAKIEDILLLYAADSMAAMDEIVTSNICWSGTAVKAAYRLGRSLGEQFLDISFGVDFLDEAMQNGRKDEASLSDKPNSPSVVDMQHIASS